MARMSIKGLRPSRIYACVMSSHDDGTDGSDLPHVPHEYEVSFDTWGIRCANALLRGLISGQLVISPLRSIAQDDSGWWR